MKILCIGLVVKGGSQFIEKWIESAERISNTWFIVDNGADEIVRKRLINHPHTKQYHMQKDVERNQSRDYQKILDMAREEDCKWIWNIDIDEYIPMIDIRKFYEFLLNERGESFGFPLFEMREDNEHYVMVKDCTPDLKHSRLCHKVYKNLSHFKFNEKDKHGQSIPHNCKSGETINIIIQHFGHCTKELREEKRKQYKNSTDKDYDELKQSWLEEDINKITIKKWGDWNEISCLH